MSYLQTPDVQVDSF